MNRRSFLKTIGGGLFAAVVPTILLPTRTIIDLNPQGYRTKKHINIYLGDGLVLMSNNVIRQCVFMMTDGVPSIRFDACQSPNIGTVGSHFV